MKMYLHLADLQIDQATEYICGKTFQLFAPIARQESQVSYMSL